MDKKDLMYGFVALVIILIIALVIKPLATGHPVNIGLPPAETSRPTILSSPVAAGTNQSLSNGTPRVPIVITTHPPDTPTPRTTWNQQVQTVGFVDPSSYGISTTQDIPNGTRIDSIPQNLSMTTYASFSGKTSGTTQTIHIPFPYWELWYTVDPLPEPEPATQMITPTQGSGYSASFIAGSYSTVKPAFTLQVMDANDPNRIVRVITPPGGIDLDLWLGVTPTTASSPLLKPPKSSTDLDRKSLDPRPWKERFYEGQRDYYFVVNSQNLKSYKIDIRVPSRYIGQY